MKFDDGAGRSSSSGKLSSMIWSGILRLVKRIPLMLSDGEWHVAWWFSRDVPAVRMGDPDLEYVVEGDGVQI
jgi:hypothetical protein